MKIVTVVPLKKGTKENLTYFTAKDVLNGSVVVVPLRSKKVLGLVISIEDVSSSKSNIKDMSFNLKKIIEVKKNHVFLKEYFDATIETCKYFAESKNNGITSMLPAVLRENYDSISKFINHDVQTKKNLKSIKSEKLLFQASFEDRISTYKTLIRGAFAEKKSVFIVFPTEHDIKIFEELLSRGIEQFTFSLHGSFNAKKVIEKIEQILTLDHPILILGTTPFLSVPRKDIKTIILEHESSNAYRMIGKPHFDLRFFAELFATKISAKFILSDTLLRFETITRKDEDGLIPLHPMQFRTNFEGKIEILGKKDDTQEKEKFKVLKNETVLEIKKSISKKKNVFIFSLRKGLATITVCKDCNETVSCEKCGAPLVLYLSHQGKQRMFVCNRCKMDKGGDRSCENCRGWNLVPLGIGTDTIYEYIKEGMPEVKVFKLDKDSVKNAKEAEKIIKEFEGSEGSILIGTEMAFFYLKNKVPLSVIASFDSLWSIPNFRMGEKIIQIMLSIINRTTEKFIIQTKNDKDKTILAIESENLLHFIREELEDRKKLEYPPYKRFIKITHLGDKEQSKKAKDVLEKIFAEYSPLVFGGFVNRLKGKYVTNALIKLNPQKWSLPEISTNSSIDEQLLSKFLYLPPSFQVLVDPEDLL